MGQTTKHFLVAKHQRPNTSCRNEKLVTENFKLQNHIDIIVWYSCLQTDCHFSYSSWKIILKNDILIHRKT